jgi:phosphodiesterase/alkaline phosphatase D-like protein
MVYENGRTGLCRREFLVAGAGELVGGSATSFGLPESLGIPSSTLQSLRQASDPHVEYADFDHRGYCVVTADKDNLIGEFKAVSDGKVPNGTVSSLAKFQVDSGKPKLNQV